MNEYLRLKKSDCKNCYKCIRYCPVKSIRFTGNQAQTVPEECILCGRCIIMCPQSARQIVDTTEIVQVMLYDDPPVIASVAPAFTAYFEGIGFASLREGLLKLGFADAEETAIGATHVKKEYERLMSEGKQDVIISSCCHSVNLLMRKYYPQILDTLAPVYSPMIAHTLDIKKRNPQAKTVFISPCAAKKEEADDSPVDAVITFEELHQMFQKAKVELKVQPDYQEESRTRLFPTVGGIIKSMDIPEDTEYTFMTIDGILNCIAALESVAKGNVHRCFIEMSACPQSCIGGPVIRKRYDYPVQSFQSILASAGKLDFDVPPMTSEALHRNQTYMPCTEELPTEAEIMEIFKKFGKMNPEDELNCGGCGYDTCRDKAIAIYQGKADITMCLPFLMKREERFSHNVLQNTTNGVLVVNEDLEVQQINSAAMQMLRVNSKADVLGEQLVRIMDPLSFIKVLKTGTPIRNRRAYYAEFNKYLSLSILHDRDSQILIAIIVDITEEEEERLKKQALNRHTAETADKVVEKQMRVVQEIASLLGETAAETKIALTKLKESITYEEE